jgi:hypothetical protein
VASAVAAGAGAAIVGVGPAETAAGAIDGAATVGATVAPPAEVHAARAKIDATKAWRMMRWCMKKGRKKRGSAWVVPPSATREGGWPGDEVI